MPVSFPLTADDGFLVDIFEEVGEKADVKS
jgi:hypothetical protein